jgi:hypothetical protein
MRWTRIVLAALIGLSVARYGACFHEFWDEECDSTPNLFDRETNDFYFSASSGEGAVGDYVAVEISLTIEALHGDLQSFGIEV